MLLLYSALMEFLGLLYFFRFWVFVVYNVCICYLLFVLCFITLFTWFRYCWFLDWYDLLDLFFMFLFGDCYAGCDFDSWVLGSVYGLFLCCFVVIAGYFAFKYVYFVKFGLIFGWVAWDAYWLRFAEVVYFLDLLVGCFWYVLGIRLFMGLIVVYWFMSLCCLWVDYGGFIDLVYVSFVDICGIV